MLFLSILGSNPKGAGTDVPCANSFMSPLLLVRVAYLPMVKPK